MHSAHGWEMYAAGIAVGVIVSGLIWLDRWLNAAQERKHRTRENKEKHAMTNADQKARIRERMARTGENYTTAKRAIEESRKQAGSRKEVIITQLADGWEMYDSGDNSLLQRGKGPAELQDLAEDNGWTWHMAEE